MLFIIKGRLNINRSTIEDNTAEIGAGIHNIGILTIKHSQILNNNGSGINNQGTLNLIDSTVQNNNSGNRSGGGIANTSGGTASILRTLFLMNQSAWGGGLYNSATITVRDSTFSGNISNNSGGGLYTGRYMGGTASMTLINVTISHNIAVDGGGGINQDQGTLNLVNTLISGNFSLGAGAGAEIYRRTGIQGKQMNNLFGHSGLSNTQAFSGFSIAASDITATIDGTTPTDLAQIISPLDKHGGPTSTFALVPNSPAIDAAVSTYGPIFFPDEGCYSPGIPGLFGGTYRDDQRGVKRPQEGACDIGAYEYEAPGFFIIPTLNGKTVIFAL